MTKTQSQCIIQQSYYNAAQSFGSYKTAQSFGQLGKILVV